MVEHSHSVTVNAPVDEAYELFSHFNDYPKFMSFVREVRYLDGDRSRWVVSLPATREFEARNEGWIENERIGWQSYRGLPGGGEVRFEPLARNETRVTFTVRYQPGPGGAPATGESSAFGERLARDLVEFARILDEVPAHVEPEASRPS
jgi:uncharacterized membrane protein